MSSRLATIPNVKPGRPCATECYRQHNFLSMQLQQKQSAMESCLALPVVQLQASLTAAQGPISPPPSPPSPCVSPRPRPHHQRAPWRPFSGLEPPRSPPQPLYRLETKTSIVPLPQRQFFFLPSSVLKTKRSVVTGLSWRDVMRRHEVVGRPPLPRSGDTKGELALKLGSAKNRQPFSRS